MDILSVIDFTDQGRGECLYTEAVNLHGLGKLHCERASELEFNAGSQKWEVRQPSSRKVLFSHRSRSRCLQWERNNLGPAGARQGA